MAKPTISPKVWTIYRVTNTVNGKIYIGLTSTTTEKRWEWHVRDAKHPRTENITISQAIRKYGPSVFTIEHEASYDNEDAAIVREIYLIARYNCQRPNGYNMTIGGPGHDMGSVTARSGWSHSAETRLKHARAKNSENHLPGACWVSSRKQWRATIRTKGKRISLGFFDTAEEAHTAYLQALEALSHGHQPRRHYRGRAHSTEKRLRMAQAQNPNRLPGVGWSKSKQRWTAMFRINGKQHRLGYFKTAEEAHNAYVAALISHYPGDPGPAPIPGLGPP